jgi:hypothetical protein
VDGAGFVIEGAELRIGDLVLELSVEHLPAAPWRTNDRRSLLLRKPESLLRALDEFFVGEHNLHALNIFELGIWDGGSSAFWFEYFQPVKLIAVDSLAREDRPVLADYVTRNGLEESLKLYWGVDQADTARLRQIYDAEFIEPLDLVIDDASHELHATRASFETLFPLLRQGGIYLIEDWRWEFEEEYRAPDHPWRDRAGLVELVRDLVTTVGMGTPVRRLTIFRQFIAVQRGA